MIDLYELIQQLCKRHNITIAYLERECGLGNGTIKRWETALPSAERLKKVADFFCVSVDYLLINKHGVALREIRKQLPFARNLTKFRKEKSLSLEDLSDLTSFTPQEIEGLERGTLISDDDIIYDELATALDITKDELFPDETLSVRIYGNDLSYWIKERKQKKNFFAQLLKKQKKNSSDIEIVGDLQALKDDLIEEFKSMPLIELADMYKHYLDKKILNLADDADVDN